MVAEYFPSPLVGEGDEGRRPEAGEGAHPGNKCPLRCVPAIA